MSFWFVAREDVAEVAGGHGEAHLAVGRAKADGGGEVVDDLREDTRPVDRVHAGKPHAVTEVEVVEHVLETRLASIEIAVDRQRVHVGFGGRRHLAALHLAHPAVGEEDEDVDGGKPAERLDRGGPRVTARRTHDRHPFTPAAQRRLEELADELHREVLEGERRAVEQLEQELVRVGLDERRARGVAEGRVGLGDDLVELPVGEAVADEGAHHAEGRVLVGEAGKGRDLGVAHRRDRLGDVEPAVAGKTRQHGFLERQRRGLSPGRHIAHFVPFSPFAA